MGDKIWAGIEFLCPWALVRCVLTNEEVAVSDEDPPHVVTNGEDDADGDDGALIEELEVPFIMMNSQTDQLELVDGCGV